MSSQPPFSEMLQKACVFQCFALFLAFCGCGREGALSKPEVDAQTARFEVPLPTGTMVARRVAASSFLMGSENGELDERPQRIVQLSGFFAGETEVTVRQYEDCVRDGDCRVPALGGECNWMNPGREEHPVNCVSWYDAVRFCEWAGGRLPTEAEWEKMGRGLDADVYPWGNESADCDRAVVGNGLGCGELSTWPVGAFPNGSSDYGVLDVVGNVYEWTIDTYDVDAYAGSASTDPVNLTDGTHKVLRGNSWYYSDPRLDSRLANRYPFPPERFYSYIGFRCVFPGEADAIPFNADAALSSPAAEGAGATWTVRNSRAEAREGVVYHEEAPVDRSMVTIPAGSFTMGTTEGPLHERPQREVELDAFLIDRYEVTVSDYADCVDEGSCAEPFSGGMIFPKAWENGNCNYGVENRAFHPMNCVNWYEASTYCSWAGKRLPTEAEWEKAARGDDGRIYPWGDDHADCDRAVIDLGGDGCGRETTWPVGSKPNGVSPYGVHDMSGNVWEWVDDWYGYSYYENAPQANPRNTQKVDPNAQEGWATGKVLRGGSWADQATLLHRTSHRLGYDPNTFPDYTIGFRCAMDAPF